MTTEPASGKKFAPGSQPRIGFALSTKERTEYTRRILSGLDSGGFDLIWCDGSKTAEGRAFASSEHFTKTPLVEVHHNVTGGPDAAIQFSLKRLLALGYDYVGLIENDIQLKPGWLPAIQAAWNAAEEDGFIVGSATARSMASRVLAHGPRYIVKWNMGAGMVLFSRAAAEAVLADYRLGTAAEIQSYLLASTGVDVSSAWELFMDQPNRPLGTDWRYASVLWKNHMISIGTIPALAENIDEDIRDSCRTDYVRSAKQELPGYCLTIEQLKTGQACYTPSSNIPSTELSCPLAGAERILFVRTDSIGDAVLASAMLEPIRKQYPQAKLAVLCQQHVAELFMACPWVYSVICYDHSRMADKAERQQILSEIAAFNPSVILNSVRSRDHLSNVLTQGFRNARHIAIEGDLCNISAADHAASLAGYELLVPSPGPNQSELEHHANFLRGLGIESQNLQPVVWLTAEEEVLADAFFQHHKLDSQQTVAIFPFTQHGIKNYPHFAAVLEKLTQWNFLIFGGSESENGCAELAAKLPGNVLNLAGRTTVREMAALIRRCRLLVGSDSCGPHIACAVGVPNVVVLGGGHFGRFMPYSPLTSVVSLPLTCFGCSWDCKYERPHCINDIAPELVTKAIHQTLENDAQRPRVFLQPPSSWPGGGALPAWQTPAARLRNCDLEIIGLEESPAPSTTGAEAIPGAPVVTAIVSTYNSERFMAACMEDMVAQTILDKLEILVIDSGSQENERAIVEQYQKRFSNIRYVRTDREPLYVAWNRAVKLARGKYVVNANTDDSRRPDAFEILLHGMEAHPDADLAYSHYGMTSKANDPFPPSAVFRDVCHDPYHPAQLLFYCITGCLQFWRKTSLEKIGGFDDRLKCVGDYEILIRFMRKGMKPLMVPEKLSCFFINREGLSFSSTRAGQEDAAVKERYRQEVDVSEVYSVDPNNPREMAKAWISLGNFAANVPVPWTDQPHTFYDYSMKCYQRALQSDPALEAAWHNLAVLGARMNITDFLIKTFSSKNPEIHAIIAKAKKNPKLVGFEFEPKVSGHIYRPSGVTPKSHAAKLQSSPSNTNGEPVKAAVDWIGSFLDHGSLSHVNRELTRALAGFNEFKIARVHNGAPGIAEFSALARDIATKPSPDAAVTVCHAWPPDWRRPNAGKLVVIQPWEFGALPLEWVKQASNVDEFWVPSEYVRRVYIESGVPAHKTVVVPNGVSPEKFHPQVPALKLATTKKFKFLFVGGTIFRKGPGLLLKAYLANFTAADDVCLVIKDFGGATVYAGQTFEAGIRAAQALPNAPEILYLNEELPPDSVPGLYTACDCLVLPYRGEGFGLPVLEAMACGRPVIVTAGGATDDFVRDTFAWRIPAERKTFGNEIDGMKLTGAGWLLEPDLTVLGQSLRAAFANPSKTRQRGQLAVEHASQYFTWKNSATIAAQRLRELGRASLRGEPSAPKMPFAAKSAPCALIGHLAAAREQMRQKSFSGAWASAMEALSLRPFHPEAFLLLAEIAQTAGDGTSAKLCAEHARAIAPGWKAAKKFLKQRLKSSARPEWLKLPPVIQNPPANVSRLSVCLIVKNEEKFLERCLSSVRDLAAQIVVVDTGSTDRTVEIAKAHGAEIHTFTWCDDFSAARNAALEHATGDWVLTLDADEELPATSHDVLRKHLRDAKVLAWRLPIVDAGHEGEGRTFVPRLFRNAPGVFFAGRVHEHPFDMIEKLRAEWVLDNRLGEAVIIHHGYTKALTLDRDKVARNLRLLELALPESPGNLVLLMSLGLELCRSGRSEEGLRRYDEAFAALSRIPAEQAVPEFRETLLTQYASQLYAARRYSEVVRILSSPLATKPGLTANQHYILGMTYVGQELFEKAAEQLRFCLAKRAVQTLMPSLPEVRSSAPQRALALCLSRTKDTAAANKEFQQALAEDPQGIDVHIEYARFLGNNDCTGDALQLLYKLASEKPDVAEIWICGAQLALTQPDLFDISLDWTATAIQHLPQNVQLIALRAEALMVAGQLDLSLQLWKTLETSAEPATLAAIVLCETAQKANTYIPSPGIVDAVEKEFVRWFQRLVSFKAEAAVGSLLENASALSRVLPKSGKILTDAVNETSGVSA